MARARPRSRDALSHRASTPVQRCPGRTPRSRTSRSPTVCWWPRPCQAAPPALASRATGMRKLRRAFERVARRHAITGPMPLSSTSGSRAAPCSGRTRAGPPRPPGRSSPQRSAGSRCPRRSRSKVPRARRCWPGRSTRARAGSRGGAHCAAM